MKYSIFVTSIVALATSSIASPIGLNIPGIINLDIGGGNGLNLNVLGGLVHANHHKSRMNKSMMHNS
ncbi:hypothetical protein LPJ60_004113 [Coemansia sp. RSA 2675]|nr:hypothetical protein LPJ60_004113 [Coemansia sp. RSA 2675]